jgi:hypothetical protein
MESGEALVENVFSSDLGGIGALSAANRVAVTSIPAASSADPPAMLGTGAAALWIGAGRLAAYAPARANNLAATSLVRRVHAAITGAAVSLKQPAIIAADNA